jgi:hypothetical protein
MLLHCLESWYSLLGYFAQSKVDFCSQEKFLMDLLPPPGEWLQVCDAFSLRSYTNDRLDRILAELKDEE